MRLYTTRLHLLALNTLTKLKQQQATLEAALKAISKKVLSGAAYTQSSGNLTEESTGVKNKPHTNYGG